MLVLVAQYLSIKCLIKELLVDVLSCRGTASIFTRPCSLGMRCPEYIPTLLWQV
jgi:hypothetical protein